MRTTNTNSGQYVQDRLEFKANNLKGVNEHGFYVVYSYEWWPLFAYSESRGIWYENIDRYSVSTSKQRNQAHPRVDTQSLSKDELMALISGGK